MVMNNKETDDKVQNGLDAEHIADHENDTHTIDAMMALSNIDNNESIDDEVSSDDEVEPDTASTAEIKSEPDPESEANNTKDADLSEDDLFDDTANMNGMDNWLIELDDPIDGTKRLKALSISNNFSKSLHELLESFLQDGYVIPEQLPTHPDPDRTVIKLDHKTKAVTREKVVHQTIKYSMVDNSKAPNSIKRQLIFMQNGVKDLVTNEIKWDDETQTQAFSKMPSPIKRGYVADEEIVPEQEITVNNKNFDLSLDKVWLINYQREVLTIRIKVIDDDKGEILKNYPSHGYDGDVLNVTLPQLATEFKKKHYLISQSDLPDKLVFESGQSPTYQVHLVHERGPLKNTDSLQTRGTYTINFVDKNRNILHKPVVLVQFYKRKAQEDYVTGQIDYGSWDKTMHLPEIKMLPESLTDSNGNKLIPLTSKIIIPNVEPDEEQSVDAIYFAPEQTIDLNFKYDNKVVNKITLKFNLREDRKISLKQKTKDLTRIGYDIINDQEAPLVYEYDASEADHREYNINVKPIFKKSIDSKIVKRIIIVTVPSGAKRSIIHSAILKRSVTTNLSNGQKEYGNWSQNYWDAYVPPKMTNYVPNQLKVEEVLINGDTKNTKIRINYIPYSASANRRQVEVKEKPQTLLEHIKSFFKSSPNDHDNQLQLDAPKNEQDVNNN